ncbi:hypothetical protein Tco_0765266 [Tanacetum coccineum]
MSSLWGVSLPLFTRSTVIRRRVEDLQLGVESYQKKLNFTRPDTLLYGYSEANTDGVLARDSLEKSRQGKRVMVQTIDRIKNSGTKLTRRPGKVLLGG